MSLMGTNPPHAKQSLNPQPLNLIPEILNPRDGSSSESGHCVVSRPFPGESESERQKTLSANIEHQEHPATSQVLADGLWSMAVTRTLPNQVLKVPRVQFKTLGGWFRDERFKGSGADNLRLKPQ